MWYYMGLKLEDEVFMSKKRRMTPKQKQAKIDAAKKSAEAAERAKQRSERTKKVVTIVVCVILVLGLSVPTMALTVCSQMKQQSNTQETQSEEQNN